MIDTGGTFGESRRFNGKSILSVRADLYHAISSEMPMRKQKFTIE
jgi:hypothetical protein